MAMVGNVDYLQEVMARDDIYNRTNLGLASGGPLWSVLFHKLNVPDRDMTKDISEITALHPEIVDKLTAFSPAMKALAWWSLWSETASRYERSQLGFEQVQKLLTTDVGVGFLSDVLHLLPPKIVANAAEL
jgi:hypothetical protein